MLRLGVDVGGTFTDLLLHDTDSGSVWLAKVPSTPHDQSQGVLEGIRVVGSNPAHEVPVTRGAKAVDVTFTSSAIDKPSSQIQDHFEPYGVRVHDLSH